MTKPAKNRPDFLEQGEPARLIPVVADSSREQRITSALLAVLKSVDEFGKHMLQAVGAPVTKTSKIDCWTEVVFKRTTDEQKSRPDGLIILTLGSKKWSAMIEAKVGTAELTREQVETYLDIAKENGVNAVITISNQFATLPTHHPIVVNKRKTKAVSLFHWSWQAIMSEAILLAEHKGVADPDQAFLLRELIRFLDHQASGVLAFTRMGLGWQELCIAIQQGSSISKNAPYVFNSLRDWYQLAEFISLKLSLAVGRSVSINISRSHAQDPQQRLNHSTEALLSRQELEAEFIIPDAAARLKVTADLKRRTIASSMRLSAPADRARASSVINWALNQVKKCEDLELIIRAHWPGRTPVTSGSLAQLKANPVSLLSANPTIKPTAFEFVKVIDLANRFRGPSVFVESALAVVPDFYSEVGQYLKAWIPPAPRIVVDGTNLKQSEVANESVTVSSNG